MTKGIEFMLSRVSIVLAAVMLIDGGQSAAAEDLRFDVSFPSSVRSEPVDGRLLLMFSTNGDREPRFQISSRINTQLVFGSDVNRLTAGKKHRFPNDAISYPPINLAEVPPGKYFVQALLHVYETFHRGDGHVVKLPMDNGEGQQWNRSPGNLYSEPQTIEIGSSSDNTFTITLDKVIPPVEPPKDTKYIKHVKIQSDLLSEFWGRPMHLGAIVLLPEGFDEHPDARYPVMVNQGHFPHTFRGFSEEPPLSDLADGARTRASSSYKLYQDWTSGRLPRMLVVLIQHANPYYDDSYGVNSANVGPYGDAIVKELIPFVEKKFRAIGEPWARALFGGSTGGWIVLAEQIFYPDFFGGAWGFCPDGIDFRGYQAVNIYEDTNAYWLDSEWKKVRRSSRRDVDGTVTLTMKSENTYELALGENARSAGQWDIWQAVYGPVGDDGYPKPIWDKRTGVIDREVAEHWKKNYDLRHILERDWKTLGPKLIGKLHIKVGDMDNYYLERGVRHMQEFLESTKHPDRGPYYGGTIEYGDGYGHCYSGGAPVPANVLRSTYYQRLMPEVETHMLRSAPKGADTKSWRY